jgi:alginate O-acetyltransferase complex protein AlgI
MLFNSVAFAVFFPLVTLAFFLLPHKFRGIMLLVASCYFYMAFIPKYILILFLTIGVDYVAGLLIARNTGHRRRVWLVLSIITNVGVLAFFKYFNFLNGNLHALSNYLSFPYHVPALNIILPIGLSFHTFQSMSYTIEVYRGAQEPEHNLWRFALYVMFYPQLVAGPIERPQNLLHQFKIEHHFDYEAARDGLLLMGWGLFKKVVVADRLAVLVDQVYTQQNIYSGSALLLATYCFAVQIYCDFSGYSDIAIGAAKVMGFRLMKNFNHPYFSRSVSEFWTRWHISLSTWFRDYVYIPMGGSRVSMWRRCFNLMVVFAVSGLWHGANWTYVVWGSLNGIYLAASVVSAKWRKTLSHLSGLARLPIAHRAFGIFVTFHLILLSWVFFRADSIGAAFRIVGGIISWRHGFKLPLAPVTNDAAIIGAALGLFLLGEVLQARGRVLELIASRPVAIRWAFYCAAVTALILLGDFGTNRQFIYFQF